MASDTIRVFVTSLVGLPEADWQTNADLAYLVECAEAFAGGRAAHAARIEQVVLDRIRTPAQAHGLRPILQGIAMEAVANDYPESDIHAAQAIEIAANDWLLMQDMEDGGAPAEVVDELRQCLASEALDVGRRLLRNAVRQVDALRVHAPLDNRKVETLGQRYTREFAGREYPRLPDGSWSRVHLVLNAGRGTRLRTTIPKGIIYLGDQPMLRYTVDAGRSAGCEQTVVVLGFKRALNECFLDPGTTVVQQYPGDGTGHALLCAQDTLRGFSGTLLVSYSDMPFIQGSTLRQMIAQHEKSGAVMTLLTTPSALCPEFGRLLRDPAGRFLRVAQARIEDSLSDQADAGFYCFKCPDVWELLQHLENRNNRYEYYLTDILEQCHRTGQLSMAHEIVASLETLGINRPAELVQARFHTRRDRFPQSRSQLPLPASLYTEPGFALYAEAEYFETYGGPDVHRFLRACASEAEVLSGLDALVRTLRAALGASVGALCLLQPEPGLLGASRRALS